MRRGLFFGCALAFALLTMAPAAAHATAAARLVYVRGPGAERCPGDAGVRAAVRSRLGYDPFAADAHDTLFAEILRRPGAFRTTVKLIDDQNVSRGTRQVSVPGNDCAAVVDLMGLTISLTIDPASATGSPPAASAAPALPPPPAAAPAPEPPPATPDPLRASPAPAARRAWFLFAGGGALGSLNAAPAATAGVTVFLGAAWKRLSLELEGRADAPATGPSDVSPVQVRSRLFAASILPCLHLGVAFGCPVLSVGTIGATARNVGRESQQYGPWSAPGGGGPAATGPWARGSTCAPTPICWRC